MAKSTKIDWDEIEKIYAGIVSALEPVEIFDEDDFERRRYNFLTYGLIPCPEWNKIEYGYAIYEHVTGDAFKRMAWSNLAAELGWKTSPGAALPDYIKKMSDDVDHRQVISDAIKKRRVSHQFIISWGRLQALHSRYLMLSIGNTASDQIVDQILTGTRQGNVEIQKHWYAHWLKANAPSLAPEDRIDAGHELAAVCKDVVSGKLEPWGPYPREWYGRLLDQDQEDLSANFQKLGEPKLQEMLNHPLVTKAVHPPLDRSKFKKA